MTGTLETLCKKESVSSLRKEASDNESNYSDSELWLCAGQKKFSRRSKRMSKKEQQEKPSQRTNHTKPKVKPPVLPKHKPNKQIVDRILLGKSYSYDDQRLQSKSARMPLGPSSSDGDNDNR